MDDQSATPSELHAPDAIEAESEDAALVEDVLVEEVSIDGMCGVY